MKKRYLILLAFFLVSSSLKAQVWGANNTRTDYRDDAGLQGNAGAMSGFYQTASPVNFPSGATGWWHLLDVRHDNPNNNTAFRLLLYRFFN